MNRIIDIEILESLASLKTMLKSERNPIRASRLIALCLYKNGECSTALEIAKSIGYSRNAVEDWFHQYKINGLEGYLQINLWGRLHFNEFKPQFICAN